MHNRSQFRLQEDEWFEKLEHLRTAVAFDMKELRKNLELEVKET